MEYLVGIGMALGVATFATRIGFDRDRSFYPTILVVVACLYGLFAAIGGSIDSFAVEGMMIAGFVLVSAIGFRTNLWLIVGGLAAHGIFDLFHGHLIENTGVPTWWPMFCASYDITAAGTLAWLLVRPGQTKLPALASGARDLRTFIDDELRAASEFARAGDPAREFRRLERAHVLAQGVTVEHVRVHVRMLIWGWRNRDRREVRAQLLRIVGAATKTAFKAVPRGNTGGSDVGLFQVMPIPEDLAAILDEVNA